jgi:hypothetical protein
VLPDNRASDHPRARDAWPIEEAARNRDHSCRLATFELL